MTTLEFDALYSAVTGEHVGGYVPTISTDGDGGILADFGSLKPEWHALTGHRSFAFGAGNSDPVFDPAEAASDDQIREWVRDAGGDTFALVTVVAGCDCDGTDTDCQGCGSAFGSELAGWAVIYQNAECAHENIEWFSGEPGVIIALNGDAAARCNDCGATATAGA